MEIRCDRYLNGLVARKSNGLVKVVTGIRRCGKSYLVFELFNSRLWLPDQVLGAYGDMRSGVGNGDDFRAAWNLIAPNASTMEIML